ncbi:MAG: FKBP-type peptidyl-prolyl cis-trans isomerase [Verrucomicrobiia bacterium]
MKSALIYSVVAFALGFGSVYAAEGAPLKDNKEKFSYALGMSLGNNLRRSGIPLDEIDPNAIMEGVKEGYDPSKARLSESEARDVIMTTQREARTRLAEKNKKEGEKFLEENKKKEGVVTLPSGLQYKIIAEGSGESPKSNDMVTVNYRGTLIDGTEFDSSYKRGQPAKFGVNGVIKGWSEALQLMKPGAKWQLFIPPELAYGERGSGLAIGPNSTLVFDVELLSVEQRPTPSVSSSAPITSDIIKVPSKEELEKGAKIEVIKAEELEKYKQAEAEKAKAGKSDAKPEQK